MYNKNSNKNITNPYVLDFATGDVNGDKIPDSVYLTGQKLPDSPFVQNITLVVRDGRTGRVQNVSLSENAGYEPKLFLGDFTGDGIKDIFITIDSGGSGAFTYDYLYSFANNIPKLLFDWEVYNSEYQYSVNFKNNFKVEVISEKNRLKYLIDITYRGAEYLNEIYDQDGKLKEPIEGFVNGVSGLYPIYLFNDGFYELLAFQKIAGRYNADSLGYIENFLKWDGSRFSLTNQYVGIFGTDIV